MKNDIIQELTDLRRLDWSKIRRSPGTGGSFLKAREVKRGRQYYYKLSEFDAYHGIVGHECVNEIIADRLLTLLQIPHLSYTLVHALIFIEEKEYETWLCRSEDFRKPGESKIAMDTYYQLERRAGESPLAFCIRMGWEEYIYRMLVTDYLILNRDRHGANMEVLRSRTEESVRPAPLFDHGLSFYFSVHEESRLRQQDPLADRPVQCFVGSRSARENLQLIPRGKRRISASLQETDRTFIFEGLEEALTEAYRDAIWEMLLARWREYESICDS